MTKMRNKLTLALAAIALMGGVGLVTTIAVARAEGESSHPFVQALAERLGLNESEVEEAFDEIRADHFAQMHENKEDALNLAVTDGVITEEQKNALMEKHESMWQERLQEQNVHKEEMDAWFESQGIDHDTFMEYMGGFGHRGMKHHGFGSKNIQ